ncbi:hypothetical protein FRC09_016391 [Ceratobasidium sp. 395]|nr:hypothetical protein FRC09_016391 [Ceratobasidium sp. 395]
MFEHNRLPAQDEDGNDIPIDGSSDTTSIQLSGLASVTLRDAELELICKTIYDMPLAPTSELDTEGAIALLHVSTKFQFETIHKRIIERLDDEVSPVQRYSLALDCLVDPWLLRSYLDICSLTDLSLAAELLVEFSRRDKSGKFWDLLRIRENYRARSLANACDFKSTFTKPSPVVCPDCLVTLRTILKGILLAGDKPGLDGGKSNSLPSLGARLRCAIRPEIEKSPNICVKCRAQEHAALAHVLELGS